jgi:hypothetical protein
MDQSLSLYFPHVFANITKKTITDTLEFQGIGKVKEIDFVEKMDKTGKLYNTAFVHFEQWYDNISALNFQERVKNPDKEARIVYNDPWFWVCFENKGKKQIPGARKERINLHDFSNIFEEEKNEVKLDQETEDKFEKEILEEFDCHENYDIMLYQKMEEPKKTTCEIDMNYVRNLEILNYKLGYDLYRLQGDFIMV